MFNRSFGLSKEEFDEKVINYWGNLIVAHSFPKGPRIPVV